VILWYPPDRKVMVVFDLRKRFSESDLLVRSVIRYARDLPAPAPRAFSGPARGLAQAPALAGVGEMPVSFWCGPPEPFATPERFKQIADAGFNYVMPPCEGATTVDANRKTLDLSAAAGLKAFVMDPRVLVAASGKVPKGTTAVKLVDAAVADYASHPAFAGFFVADEPTTKQFKNLGVVVRRLRRVDAAHIPFVNLFPSYAKELGTDFGAPTYEDYLQRYLHEVGPTFLSYDHYSLMRGRDRPGMYANLDAVRRAAAGSRIPFWQIVLATADEQQFRPVSESEKRYQAMQTLAYGGRGLMWFTYWQPQDYPPWVWDDAIVNRDGTPTPQYAEVARVNRDLRALGRWLYRAASVGVFQTGEVAPDGQGPRGNEPVRVVGDGNFTVGLFADGPTSYALFANRDYKKGATSEVLVSSGGAIPQHLDRATGVWAAVAGAVAEPGGRVRLTVPVGAGDGELYRW
jgi:hypothetical protein